MIDKQKLLENLRQTLEKEKELNKDATSEYDKGFSYGVQCELNELIKLIENDEFKACDEEG